MNIVSSRLTPIDDFYPSCDWTRAAFCVNGVDPEVMTQKLGIPPTRWQKEGVLQVSPSGHTRIGRINSWVLSTEESGIKSKDLRAHLDWLLDRIEPRALQLLDLQSLPNVKMAVRCPWFAAFGGGGPALWPEQMGRMAKLNLECLLSFSDYESEEKANMEGEPEKEGQNRE